MTYKNDKPKMFIALMLALILVMPSVGIDVWHMVYGATVNNEQKPSNEFPEQRLYEPPQLSEIKKSQIISKALSHQGIKSWSPTGWEVASLAFAGSTEPTIKWDTVNVILKLPSGKGQPLAACATGWDATITMNLETLEIIDAWYPKDKSLPCDGDYNKSGPLPESVVMPSFIPQADAINAYLVARENDVSGTPSLRSNLAYIKTPSFNTAIYSNMDKHVTHLLNQKWNNDAFTQEGYDITHSSPCPTCGYSADSAAIVYVDTATYGNTFLRRVGDPLMTYTGNNSNLLVQSTCEYTSPTNYRLQFTYNGRTWVYPSGVPCTAILKTTDSYNNSVFFENANTVSSSGWASQITGSIQASNAKEQTTTGVLQNWVTSTNSYVKCNGSMGTATSSNMTGTLAGASTATWLPSTMARAC